MAPQDSEFERAAKWSITVPRDMLHSTVSNVFLRIDYTGDVARLSTRGDLLDDDFYNGVTWTIGLRRFMPKMNDGPLVLSILPLRKDAPVFLEKRFRPRFGSNGQMVDLKSVTLIPQYQFRIEMVTGRENSRIPAIVN